MFKIERIIRDTKPFMKKVYIERKEVDMEVDSGTSKSTYHKYVYEIILLNIKLKCINITLKTYDDSIMSPYGEM